MDENDPKTAVPIAMIVERRRQRSAELSSEDVMRILRKRAAKAARRVYNDPDPAE